MADNLTLGRGRLMFAPYAPGQTTGDYIGYLGNTSEFNLASNPTKLDHYSSESGLKVKDRSVQLQVDVTATFITDNISPGNLILWFGGTNQGDLPADAPNGLGDLFLVGAAKQIYGSLLFLSDNPVGDNYNYWFPYVSLSASGNYSLKGDAWQALTFSAECLKRDTNTERFYAFTPTVGESPTNETYPYLTADWAAVAGGGTRPTGATGGSFANVPATVAHGADLPYNYSLTGGDDAYAFFHNGTANVGPAMFLEGATGDYDATAPATTGTYTIKAYGNSAGTGTAIATSSSISVT